MLIATVLMVAEQRVTNVDGLRDELAGLLRSIEDLQAEHDAGDLDDGDFAQLTDDYTVRAADLARRIETTESEQRAGSEQTKRSNKEKERETSESEPLAGGRDTPWLRRAMVLAGAFGFAIAAGLLLARFTGERGVNDELTGNIDASTRQQSFECQGLASGNGNGEADILGALECYDDVLTQDPDNLEALSYRGWLLVLTAQSAQQSSSDDQATELLESGLAYLDRAVTIDPTFIDARAFRASTYDRQGRADEACAEVAALLALDPPEFFVQQTTGIVERNNC